MTSSGGTHRGASRGVDGCVRVGDGARHGRSWSGGRSTRAHRIGSRSTVSTGPVWQRARRPGC